MILFFAHQLGMGAGTAEDPADPVSAGPGLVSDLGVGLFSGFLGG